MSRRPLRLPRLVVAGLMLQFGSVWAQAPATPAAEPAPAPSPPTPAATPGQRVEITGGRGSDSEQRRQSTAAKIVIGREEIERQGDATLGEILKRLPGVTIGGAPGRGGAIRFRGLGAGYTQILLDGDRVPPGFSLDSLSPEQIERIEILRAPTAETGARAIGGTINIITREGYQRRVNDVQVGGQYEHGHGGAGGNWTRNVKLDDAWTMNLSLSARRGSQEYDSATTTIDEDLATGTVTRQAVERYLADETRSNVHLATRLQWQGERGQNGFLAPFVTASEGRIERASRIDQSIGADPPAYDHSSGHTDWRFAMLRVLGQWRHILGDGLRAEWRGNGGESHSRNHTQRFERDAADALLATVDDEAKIRDRSLTLGLKLSQLLDNEHSLVGGGELEAVRRTETRTSTRDGVPLLTDFGENLQAKSTRAALYLQDEWTVNPNWAAHAGLRWEGITTQGTGEDGTTPRNRSSVWTPLLHAVWKPNPQGRDQIRMSLTRSYKAPSTQQLLGRPSLSQRYPVPGANTPTSPDRAGNPELKPELATGIDLAAERYLGAGGVLSANLFVRQIRDYLRNVTSLETVSWATVPRWVSRPQNVGDASTRGVELEAKFRLSEVMTDAPPLELRANASVFDSSVKSVPGPDNRLDQQPKMTANLGADYRFRGTPLTVGGNLNLTPGYETRISDEQTLLVGRKRVFDAYALWTFQPGVALRLSATNLAPLDYLTGGSLDFESAPGVFTRETSRNLAQSYTTWQLRLELKL
ncbi:MAG: TonB-dependent receptor [Burkholderiaceae bacterium]|nr:TonB-dependent receptor [Burkholderiaceae bacterium]